MTECAPVWIVHSIGTREGRDIGTVRQKDGRLQRQVEIFANKGCPETRGKPRWVDAALVFSTEADAKAALVFARIHRERHAMQRTLSDVLVGIDYIASLAVPLSGAPQ